MIDGVTIYVFGMAIIMLGAAYIATREPKKTIKNKKVKK